MSDFWHRLGIAQTSLALHSLTRKVRAISEGINSVYATPTLRYFYKGALKEDQRRTLSYAESS